MHKEAMFMDKEFSVLTEVAMRLAGNRVLTEYARCGNVACALLTDKGNVYTGISISTKCSMGFCAEHSAIADMLKAGETKIIKLVSASQNGIVPCCGRCREFIRQINEEIKKNEAYADAFTKSEISDYVTSNLSTLAPGLSEEGIKLYQQVKKGLVTPSSLSSDATKY